MKHPEITQILVINTIAINFNINENNVNRMIKPTKC